MTNIELTRNKLPKQFSKDGDLFIKQTPGKTTFGKANEKVNHKFTWYRHISDAKYTNTVIVVTKENKHQLRLKNQLYSYLKQLKAI